MDASKNLELDAVAGFPPAKWCAEVWVYLRFYQAIVAS